ncbi:MAG: hypothetical protein ABRQ24_06535 [Syntrophomonadaceae bacterium]
MILYILLTILFILIAVLFIPFRFYGQGRISEDIRLEWDLAWAGGLVSVRWNLPAAEEGGPVVRLGPWTRTRSPAPARAKRRQQKPSREPRRRGGWPAARAFLDKQVLREVLAFLGRLWRSLRLRWDLEGDYGTDDPALTASIAAIITFINRNGQKCRLSPRFTEAGVNLTGSIQGQLRPGIILWDAGRFALKKPIRKIWWTMLREGNKDRRNGNV